MLRAWTTTLCIASTLLFACGDDDGGGGDSGDTGDSSGTDAAVGDNDSGGGSDGSTDNADAAGGDLTGIPCADDTCEAGTEVCCAGEGGLTCETTCDTVSFACDGPEDCTGDNICCGSGADGTVCATAADCGDQQDGDVVCHVADDCPEAGQDCCMAPTAEVGTCRAHCPGA